MKKECLKARELMTLLIDNKIDSSDLEWFNRHIFFCNSCAKEFKEIKKIVSILKTLEPKSVPSDFYFKMNKILDEIEEKRKGNIFFNLQIAFRIGLVFAIIIFGFVVTLKVVRDNRNFVSTSIEEIVQKNEFLEAKKINYTEIKKDKNLIDTNTKLDIAVTKKSLEIPILVTPASTEIEYKKAISPFKLVSTDSLSFQDQKTVKRTYMHPMQGKFYYTLVQEQIQDDFGLKVFGISVDDEKTWKNIRTKYNINELVKVDFQSEMLILIIVEDKSVYSVEIVNALQEINKMVILYKLNRLKGEDLMSTNTDLKDYDIKIISKTQLPVVFKRIE